MTTGKKVSSFEHFIDIQKVNRTLWTDIEHRLETVAIINHVEYVNDSKATDFESSWYSLESMDKPVIWMVGCNDVTTDYSRFKPLAQEKISAIVCFGKKNQGLKDSLGNCVPVLKEYETVKDALCFSREIAKQGEVILFSPASPSFDLFNDYRERGEEFRMIVKEFE